MSLKYILLKVFHIILKYLVYLVFPYKEYLYQNNEKNPAQKDFSRQGKENKSYKILPKYSLNVTGLWLHTEPEINNLIMLIHSLYDPFKGEERKKQTEEKGSGLKTTLSNDLSNLTTTEEKFKLKLCN